MRLLVCGSRTWTCRRTIAAWLYPFAARWHKAGCPAPQPLLIHGACGQRDERGQATEGADVIAHDVGFELGFAIQACPADWDQHGDDAGPIRNREMAETWKPTRGLAFGALTRPSRRYPGRTEKTGTGGMVEILNAMGVLVTVVPRPGVLP